MDGGVATVSRFQCIAFTENTAKILSLSFFSKMPEILPSAPATFQREEELKVSVALGWYAGAFVGRFNDPDNFTEACAELRTRLAVLCQEMILCRTGADQTTFVYQLGSFMRRQWEKEDIPEQCRKYGIDPAESRYATAIDKAYERIYGLMIANLATEVQLQPLVEEAKENSRRQMAQLCEGGSGI